MKTQVTFRGFEALDHLRTYVEDCLNNSVGKLDLGHIDEVKVIVGTTNSRRLGHKPQFLCEAVMKTQRRVFFAKKIDLDFQSSVRKCMKALSKRLINTTRTRRDKRRSINRHQSTFEFHEMSSAVA